MIRPVKISDASAIASIYNHYILHTYITFEEEVVTTDEIKSRIESRGSYPWLVLEQDHKVLGYAYATAWKSRSAYRYTVESSIYLSNDMTGKGVGIILYDALLKEINQKGFIKVLAGIALPNDHSVSFHEAMGFRKVGQLERVGIKFGEWIDVGYWEKEFK